MDDTKRKFDAIFSAKQTSEYRNGEPERYVKRILDYKNSGSVLDLGAGDGRNSLFLASKGFNVTAVDISTIGLDKLKRFAHEQGVSIDTIACDLAQWSFTQNYDVIVLSYVTQHLTNDTGLKLLESMKKHTLVGGLNSIIGFTKESDFFRLPGAVGKFYLDNNWLKEFYSDWNILEYEGSIITPPQKKWDGNSMTNTLVEVLAQNIRS